MARKKLEIQPITAETPVYSIGVAAQLVNVHPRTLRIYEDEGLVKPARNGNRRIFSQNDIIWLLRYAPCWEITDCPRDVCESCTAQIDVAVPKALRIAGDKEAERLAKEKEVAMRRKSTQQKSDKKTSSS